MALCRGGATPAAGRRFGWAWELRWGEVNPFPRSIGAVGGRRWELDGGLGAAAALLRGGGVLVEEARRGRVQELQSGDGELAVGSFGAEGGWRGELHGGYGGAALMAGDGGSGRRRRLGLALVAGRGVEGEVESFLAKQMEGRREGRGARREKADSARRRRGGSASNLGARAYGRRRMAMSRSFREEPERTR